MQTKAPLRQNTMQNTDTQKQFFVWTKSKKTKKEKTFKQEELTT